MIDLSHTDTDDLYWVTETPAPTPKRKRIQADEESLDDSTSTVKTAITTKSKALKSVLKNASATENNNTTQHKESDATTIASQSSAISQLTEQVSQIKMENKQLLEKFDWLATKMEQFLSSAQTQTTRRHAGGHRGESGGQT